MAKRCGPAKPRGVTWKGAGGCVIVSQARQEKRSRTVWTTFHWRGITSNVSVMSSPSFDNLADPQQGQRSGAAMTTRSRRQVRRKRPARRPPALERSDHLCGRLLRGPFVLTRRSLKLFQLQFHLVEEPRPSLRAA